LYYSSTGYRMTCPPCPTCEEYTGTDYATGTDYTTSTEYATDSTTEEIGRRRKEEFSPSNLLSLSRGKGKSCEQSGGECMKENQCSGEVDKKSKCDKKLVCCMSTMGPSSMGPMFTEFPCPPPPMCNGGCTPCPRPTMPPMPTCPTCNPCGATMNTKPPRPTEDTEHKAY